jgi:hypothetical protein
MNKIDKLVQPQQVDLVTHLTAIKTKLNEVIDRINDLSTINDVIVTPLANQAAQAGQQQLQTSQVAAQAAVPLPNQMITA